MTSFSSFMYLELLSQPKLQCKDFGLGHQNKFEMKKESDFARDRTDHLE